MMSYIPRLKQQFQEEMLPKLQKEKGYANIMDVPRLEKIVLNQGVGEAVTNKKALDNAIEEMTAIAGQKAVSTKAKKAISGFKVKKNMPIGVKVTLRRGRMYEFLDRLIAVSLPRVRDFAGISPHSFDGHGNYTLAINEQIIFPEIDIDKVEDINGMDITFVTSADNDEEAYDLLKELGLPFREPNQN